MTTIAESVSQPAARADATPTVMAAVLAFALGVALVFTVGFAGPEMIHNAAHDTRHATGFPCH